MRDHRDRELPDIVPVKAIEERMKTDLIDSSFGAETVLRFTEEALDEVLGGGGDVGVIRELEGLPEVHDLSVGLSGLFSAERRIADQHLVHDHSH